MIELIGGTLYQWDIGRIAVVTPETDYNVTHVHFTTRKMENALVVETYELNGVTLCAIPNLILQQDANIYAYDVCKTETATQTISITPLSITARNKPDDYIYTENEVYDYKKIEARIADAIKDLEEQLGLAEEATTAANEKAALADAAAKKANEAADGIENIVGELKSDLVDCNLIRNVDFSDVTDGHYVNKNGVIDSSYNFSYTKPVSVKKGQTVIMRGAGANGYIAMISEFLGGSSYNPLITDNGNTVQDYTYIVPRDMQLTLSYNRTTEYSCKIYYDVSNNDANIESKFSAIGLSKNIDFTNAVQGSFVASNGLIQSSGSFAHLNNIPVSKGDTVTFVARGYNTGVAMIAMVNGNNEFTPLVKSIDSTIRTYEYTFKKPCVICLSYNNNHIHSCTITKNIEKLGGNFESLFGHGILFPRIAVIGDSLASGELVINGHAEDVYGNSWLSFLARKTNASARTHYSQGGLTAQKWLNTYLTKMQSDAPFNAYFIALGTNDCFSHPYDIGTISDESGSNTFVGYYKQIVDSVRTKAPNCVIFCVSTYNNAKTHIPYNQMIKDIADLYDNCFFVDFVGNTQIYTSTGSVWSDTSHFTTIGYNYVASVIYQLINDIVDNNPQFFKWFGKYNSVGEKYND